MTTQLPMARRAQVALATIVLIGYAAVPARTDDPPAPLGRYGRLLQKAPEARQKAIIEVIGQRGDAADLAYLLDRATKPAASGGFPEAARRQALAALADGATRDIRPTGDLGGISDLLGSAEASDAETCAGAARLAGLWRVEPAVPTLAKLAEAPTSEAAVREAALEALARINDESSRAALGRLASATAPPELQRRALAALARVDPNLAADRTAELATAAGTSDLGSILAPVLDQQGGPDRLAAALQRRNPSPEAARAILAAVQGLGRSEEGLIGPLAQRAGVGGGATFGLTPADLARYNVEVPRDGDPVRGEAVFRRLELNCQKCHALNGAAGGVGPELTSLGLSSPVDYIARSILEPDESIKEEYQTRIVSLDDGRVIQGIVLEEDDRRVVLKDANGDRREVAVGSIEESRRGGSLMPKGLVNSLSRGEFLDLCRFLSELGRPGPYAIRTTPTIQRWRALRPTPPRLLDAPTVPTTASTPPGTEWVPLYAWTDGHLPSREVAASAGGPVALVEGEVAVTTPGTVRLRLEGVPANRSALFLNGQALTIAADQTLLVDLPVGAQRLSVRVDGRDATQSSGSIRLEVIRAGARPAEFTVVGGK